MPLSLPQCSPTIIQRCLFSSLLVLSLNSCGKKKSKDRGDQRKETTATVTEGQETSTAEDKSSDPEKSTEENKTNSEEKETTKENETTNTPNIELVNSEEDKESDENKDNSLINGIQFPFGGDDHHPPEISSNEEMIKDFSQSYDCSEENQFISLVDVDCPGYEVYRVIGCQNLKIYRIPED